MLQLTREKEDNLEAAFELLEEAVDDELFPPEALGRGKELTHLLGDERLEFPAAGGKIDKIGVLRYLGRNEPDGSARPQVRFGLVGAERVRVFLRPQSPSPRSRFFFSLFETLLVIAAKRIAQISVGEALPDDKFVEERAVFRPNVGEDAAILI
jgi:hypothetical protein